MMGGGWDRWDVSDFNQPVAFGIAVAVLVPWRDANEEHPLTVRIEHQDGTLIRPDLQAMVTVGRPAHAIQGQSFRVMLGINGVWTIPGPGTYVAIANLSGRYEKRAAFHAVQKAPARA